MRLARVRTRAGDDAETQADELALAFGKAVKHLGELLLKHGEAGCIGRHDRGIVFYEIAQFLSISRETSPASSAAACRARLF